MQNVRLSRDFYEEQTNFVCGRYRANISLGFTAHHASEWPAFGPLRMAGMPVLSGIFAGPTAATIAYIPVGLRVTRHDLRGIGAIVQ